MGFFRDYKYSSTKVTAICSDTNNGNFIWLAFSANSGSCLLLKVSATNLTQVYFTVVVPVTSINAIQVINGYVFCAVTSPTIFSIAYLASAPLTTYITMNYPVGITESPIAVIAGNSSDVWYLTPGNATATFSALIQASNLNVFEQTVIMNQQSIYVNNAVSLSIDASSNLWVITTNNLGALIRAWFQSGGWDFQETVLS
jgi:hypothetical protein